MKKISILGTIVLIITSPASLIACNNQQEYIKEELTKLKEKNKINTTNQEIRDNLEWITPQESPFNTENNKYYFIIWRGGNTKWIISEFLNNAYGSYYTIDEKSQLQVVAENSEYFLGIKKFYNDKSKNKITISKTEILNIIKELPIDDINNIAYFKSVYRWNLDISKPNLYIDKDGNIKVNE